MTNFNLKEKIKYIERFLMVTKENLIIYSNKNFYLSSKQPLCVISIKNIKKVVLFKLGPKNIKYDHFFIVLNKNENNFIFNCINTFSFDDNNEDFLILFKSNEKLIAKKWFVLLNFLIDFNKKNQL